MLALMLVFPLFSGDAVPDFSLKKMDGSTFKLSEHIGKKVLIIDFWATWCKPCKKLLKKLDKINKEYKDQVEVIAISTDDASAFAKVESYIKGKGFKFTVLLDPAGTVSRMFNPAGTIPFSMIVDKNGKIVHTHSGYMPGYEKQIIKKIKRLSK